MRPCPPFRARPKKHAIMHPHEGHCIWWAIVHDRVCHERDPVLITPDLLARIDAAAEVQ